MICNVYFFLSCPKNWWCNPYIHAFFNWFLKKKRMIYCTNDAFNMVLYLKSLSGFPFTELSLSTGFYSVICRAIWKLLVFYPQIWDSISCGSNYLSTKTVNKQDQYSKFNTKLTLQNIRRKTNNLSWQKIVINFSHKK